MIEPVPLLIYHRTDHAQMEMRRPEEDIISTEQVDEAGKGRIIFQSRIELGETPKAYLLRVIVDIERNPPVVISN